MYLHASADLIWFDVVWPEEESTSEFYSLDSELFVYIWKVVDSWNLYNNVVFAKQQSFQKNTQ